MLNAPSIASDQHRHSSQSGQCLLWAHVIGDDLCYLNVVACKRPGRPKKTWDEVLVDDRKKLGMDSADP